VQGYEAAWLRVADGGWVGVGLDPASAEVGGAEVHNMLLKAWLEAGWLGAVGMVLVVISAIGTAAFAARGAPAGGDRRIAAAILSASVAFIVMAMSAPMLHQRYAWVAVALAVSACAIVRARQRPVASPHANV
jgi:O-antigen ligase